jgi:spoIIIJ-associated protein
VTEPGAEPLSVEATGETVGEAKWLALRELERRHPALDRSAVSFQVVTEGERGLLGVGYAPARVLARVDPGEVARAAPETAESPLAAHVREVLEQVAAGIGVSCRIEVEESEDELVATFRAGDLGLLIGRHGQTIDAIQYLANAIVNRDAEERKQVVVDAGGYRERRTATLEALARRSAERALASGEPVELEPMSPVERKVVHVCLQDVAGIETHSEGSEPNRYVVVAPAGA